MRDRIGRRDFFGMIAAAAALSTTSACENRRRSTVVPYTKRPAEVLPGVASFYASTFPEGPRSYAVLVQTREGRPIHITGNPEHPRLEGKTSPRALADLLGLYDPDRLRAPRIEGQPATWTQVDHQLGDALGRAKREGRAVLLLSGATSSPTRQALLADLKAALPTLDHLEWEPGAGEAAQRGAQTAFGVNLKTQPLLHAAKVILSLGADFLSGDDPEAIAAFTAQRRPDRPTGIMNRLWVLEGPMTLTGANADERWPVRPSKLATLGFALARALHDKYGMKFPPGVELPLLPSGILSSSGVATGAFDKLAEDLHSAGREAVVLCGEAMPAEAHVAAHLLNAMLGSGGVALRPARPLATLADLGARIRDMAAGRYAAALLLGTNPAYAYPKPQEWLASLQKVPTRVWMGLIEDESAAACQLVLPEHHWLEAWGDHVDGDRLTLQQPAIGPLYDSRQSEELILSLVKALGGRGAADYHSYLRARWEKEVYQGGPVPFDRFFQVALHDGLVSRAAGVQPEPTLQGSAVGEAARRAFAQAEGDGLELLLRPGTQVYDGRCANNLWLQELPDPVTKVTWGNPLSISLADARQLGVQDGDRVALEVAGSAVEMPVVVQPGQAHGVLALALGYGRGTGSAARGIGINAYPFLDPISAAHNLRRSVKLARGRGRAELAVTQRHNSQEGRELARSWTLEEFAGKAQSPRPDLATLYPEQRFPEHKWGMVIDLSACVGCSACVLACQCENNIATVGPEQVQRGREMHWIRIDRYHHGPEENPTTVHQPMLCQQCDDAPCENVCPVNATNHSDDGLNQMVYNRCVGTRYCANNCPYKVRRFNFLEYTAAQTEPLSLVHNPEVTVRPRGVMEKCTFCVQRIQDARVRAKAEGRDVRDGEITPACAAACPSRAIIFGNLLDQSSRVSRLARSSRGYKALEEIGTRPAMTYLARLSNPAHQGGSHGD